LAAEQGNVSAQNNLNVLYQHGQGVRRDYEAAARWATLAAKQGDAIAQHNLGWMYLRGQGVLRDYQTAAKWTMLAAEQGFSASQYNLGEMYRKGEGVTRDYVKSYMWFTVAGSDATFKKVFSSIELVVIEMTPAQVARAQELAAKCMAQSFKNCGS
jgi:TPR repeat protein